jgi:4'-phosphopantetheinyl transferase
MAATATFRHSAPNPHLDRGEIHIWHARLNLIPPAVPNVLLTLSSDERERAESFRFEKGRNQYAISRGILRTLLGEYLDVQPASLHFCYSSFGKPFLPPDSVPYPIHFSVSHSDGLAVFAFSRDQEIGIDLERIRPTFEVERIAKAFLPPAELSKLHSLAPSERPVEFFRQWTRLESCAKTHGIGLSLLDGFEAPSPPQAHSLSQPAGNSCGETSSWAVEHFTPQTGYIAALAATVGGSSLKHWRYPGRARIFF